jgi:pimeloyl-ACP methyl ester carboxylesterase
MPMRRADITVDVSEACALSRPLHIVATTFLPPPDRLAYRQPVVFAMPGGGYSRGYYDMRFPGHAGYSQAEHHVAHGLVFVGVDHLGVGDSSPEVCDELRIEDIAAANDIAVREISRRLRDGDVVPGYPPIDVGPCVGMGQSMGGGVAIIMAGRHRTFDAIAVLGYSAIHTVLPQRRVEDQQYVDKFDYSRDDAPETFSLGAASEAVPEFLYPFFYEDVPAEIVAADTSGGYPIREVAPAFGSTTLPLCVIAMLSPGYVKQEAADVTVPVFVGLGKRDTAPDPHSEPSAYSASSDITVFICERMAHMHNFATTREALWDRVARWCAAL